MFEKLDFDLIKIPSHEVYNIELIKEAVKRYKYVLVSLGACTWSEIIKIKENFFNIIPMHCVSSYPLEPNMANFPKMREIKKLFNNFGYSGHYSGIEDAIIAIAEGAHYIEKHFTIDRSLPGPDHRASLEPNELSAMDIMHIHIKDIPFKDKLMKESIVAIAVSDLFSKSRMIYRVNTRFQSMKLTVII